MSNIKTKLLPILLCVSIVLFCFIPCSVESKLASNIAKELDVLKGINILASDINANDLVTRANLALILLRISGAGDIGKYKDANGIFKDVSVDMPEFGAINYMMTVGLMVGFEDNTFRPKDNITTVQLIKTLVAVLGYDKVALEKGGFPSGYLNVAAQIGLLKGFEGNIDEEVSAKTLSRIVYKALSIDLMELKTGGSYGVSDRYLLRDVLKIEKGTGKLLGTYNVTIAGAINKKDEVLIDTVVYKTNKNLDNLVSCTVEFFYKSDAASDDKFLLYLTMTENNDVITVDSYNMKYKTDNKTDEFVYTDSEGEAKKVKIRLPFVTINGERTANFNIIDLYPSNGFTKLIDNNSDGVYDYAFVQRLENYFVSSKTDKLIYDLYGKPQLSLDAQEQDKEITFELNGKKATADAIEPNNVLSVANGSKTMKVYISQKTEAARIDEIEYDGTNIKHCIINGYPYSIDGSYRGYNNPIYSVGVGTYALFYMDVNDNIVALRQDVKVDITNAGDYKKYGYLIDAGTTKRGIDKTYAIKILTEKDGVNLYEMEKTITYNGIPILSENCITVLNGFAKDTNPINEYKKIITYELNEKSKVIKIAIALTKSEKDSASMDRPIYYAKYNDIISRPVNKAFANYYYMDENTVSFIVPGDKNDKNYKTVGYDYYKLDNLYYDLVFMDVSEFNVPRIIIDITGISSNSLSPSSPIFIVNKKVNVATDDGNAVKLTGFLNMKKTDLIVKDDFILARFQNDTVKMGDVLRVNINGQELLDYELFKVYPNILYRPAHGKADVIGVPVINEGGEGSTIFGRIEKKDDRRFKLCVGYDETNNWGYSAIGRDADPLQGQYVSIPYVWSGSPNTILLVDYVSNRVREVNVSNIEHGWYAFYSSRYGAWVNGYVVYNMPDGYFNNNFKVIK